ncbi:Sm-like ribonucleo protein [Aduncisulcus paluster]|uniref:Sm protein B n=1 Tax=Aduncisulcus paluster TaxID=2918883 RepID=A0ABQ5K7D6_9EUKA|nr:Sm-like ribonucleo protein [Aduncisulcus paluster]GKT26957.1 Sm-like ribonucleo protein [Aduncisulcus paluster]
MSHKFDRYLNHMVRVYGDDGREYYGQLIGFDIYQNLALSATDEFRKVKRTGEIEKRHLGLIVLRGKTISQIQIAGPATKQLLIKHRLAAAASAAKRAATVLDKHPPAPPSAPQTGLPVSGSGLPK